MYPQNDLYQAILARRSVRRYDKNLLDRDILGQIQTIASGVPPLVPVNRFEAPARDVQPEENLVESLGGYGRILTPPHYLVPYIVGEEHPLVDLGYRVEQIAVRLTLMGVGTCYVGSLRREAEVRERFSLPAKARIGAFLAFGWPSTALSGRTFNTLMRRTVRATSKLPAARIFFQDTFEAPSAPPTTLARLVEAARHAPSAVNAQPWRFLWRAHEPNRLHLFVTKNNLRYGRGSGAAYRLYDGGICMGNVALALDALGMAGRWIVHEGPGVGVPDHPTDLEPLATLMLGDA